MTDNEKYIVSVMEYNFAYERSRVSLFEYYFWLITSMLTSSLTILIETNRTFLLILSILFGLNAIFYYMSTKKYEQNARKWLSLVYAFEKSGTLQQEMFKD